MRVVIVGAGDVGRALAARLGERHQVLLLDHRVDCLSMLGAPLEPDASVEGLEEAIGVRCVRGDGTSRLVLESLYHAERHCGLVTITGDDEQNLEAGRLARSAGYDPVVALMRDPTTVERYREARITALDHSQLLAEQVETVLHHKGAVVPSGIGFGRGELVEIRLTLSSPVLHRPLRSLALHSWRVAAVFRGDELIVPAGDTTLEVDDRVLLVGDPAVLTTVTEYLRLGTPQFPRPFGPNVVTLEFAGSDHKLGTEAEELACACGATAIVRGTPDGEQAAVLPAGEEPLTRPVCKSDVERRSFALLPRDAEGFVARIQAQRPGVVLLPPQMRHPVASMLGLRGRDAELCDDLPPPLLFTRGSFPYRRILLPVSYAKLNIAAAEVAIDITRQLGATLTAVNVDLPRYLSGLTDDVLHEEVVPVRRLCELYEVPLDYRHRWGNPVHHILLEARQHDLVVVARHHRRRDSFADPDVALRVARAAPCSVLVLTMRGGA
ncbi:MAG: NAD-binding protein [Pseudomonadota bacterium]